jgi:D-inositol-3-phosphate glycosyltransferase
MAFPSSYEGFGMVVLEAMSQRLPVVATPVGCATMLVRDGETGVTVATRDSGALADALAHMLSDPDLRVRLADAAFQHARTMTWTRTAEATIAVYERARAKNAKAAKASRTSVPDVSPASSVVND